MIIAILSAIFTLIGFMLLGYVSIAYFPFLLLCLVVYLLYKFGKFAHIKQAEKHRPNYQNGGITPRGVAEDTSERVLSFKPKN